MPLTDRDRLEALGLIHEVRMELTTLQKAAVRIEMEGGVVFEVNPSSAGWAAVPGFTNAEGAPNFWQQALPFDDGPAGTAYIRTKGVAGTGGPEPLSVPCATVLWVLRGSLRWAKDHGEAYVITAPACVCTPANGVHVWQMLEDTQCIVEILPPDL
jgi:hypothetical protein